MTYNLGSAPSLTIVMPTMANGSAGGGLASAPIGFTILGTRRSAVEPAVAMNNVCQLPEGHSLPTDTACGPYSPSTPQHEMSRARTLNRGYMLHFAPAP